MSYTRHRVLCICSTVYSIITDIKTVAAVILKFYTQFDVAPPQLMAQSLEVEDSNNGIRAVVT